MSNHPNRGQFGPFSTPTPQQVKGARKAAGMTQTEAATTIYSTLRRWQDWEGGTHRMHPGLFELFRIKTNQ